MLLRRLIERGRLSALRSRSLSSAESRLRGAFTAQSATSLEDTLATRLLGMGASEQQVADIFGNRPPSSESTTASGRRRDRNVSTV